MSSREELQQYLCEVASSEFYAYAPRADGDFIEECDEDEIVWAALTQYEEQLEEFFGSDV